ncbi:MAG: SDR family NAD(P)-dependent oxidoreductase [Chloroflexota bacterium]
MKVVITGGAGFIGCNLANKLVRSGHQVTIVDNLSRQGSDENLEWLRAQLGEAFRFLNCDIRDWDMVQVACRGAERIYHLASQVAVTSSVLHPRQDFEVNALGTLNVLEAARLVADDPVFVYASTNKVYGGMEDLNIVAEKSRYRYQDLPYGVPESYPLDFHSPYGCSKGSGDQYTRDYSRIFGLRTIVFRQSCIYGQRQFGVEDQGWVAHFVIAAINDRPITLYGDGKQVRDLLHVDDLIRAYELAVDNIEITKGRIYNLGGGPDFSLSIWSEFGPILRSLVGHEIEVNWSDWRPGDQRIFVSDVRKAKDEFGWKPRISPQDGIPRLYRWVQENHDLIREQLLNR